LVIRHHKIWWFSSASGERSDRAWPAQLRQVVFDLPCRGVRVAGFHVTEQAVAGGDDEILGGRACLHEHVLQAAGDEPGQLSTPFEN
jgi:hypothetical protein